MNDERKYAILFAATILAARQLADLGDLADRPCPAREVVLKTAIERAGMIPEDRSDVSQQAVGSRGLRGISQNVT
jgi:hypothetical protein